MFSRRRMLLGCITLGAALALCVGLQAFFGWGRAQLDTGAALSADTLRLHIRAASDTIADQTDKLAVRDALLAYLDAHCTASTQPEARAWATAHLPDLPPPGRWRGGAVLHRCGCSWWKCTSIPPGIPPAFCPPGGIRLCGSTLARHPAAGTGGACSTPACAAPPAAATPLPPKTTLSAGSTSCGSSAWKHGRDGPPAAGTRSSSAAVKSRPFPALHKLIVEGV